MNIRWNKPENKTDSFEIFDDDDENFILSESKFDEEDEISLINENHKMQKKEICNRKKDIAAWRKIEDFWDDYELNKKINDDIYN